MGKKRKAAEVAEEDRIKTIIVRCPYGWNDPRSWNAEDRKRNDNGLYVFVEWLEYILGGAGVPGSLTAQRRNGPAIQDIWIWSGRPEALVSISDHVDSTLQIGKHAYSKFLRNPPGGIEDSRESVISWGKYQAEDQIMGRGEGWKPAPVFESVPYEKIRREKFVDPYPSPGLPPIRKGLDLGDVKTKTEVGPGETKPSTANLEAINPLLKQEEGGNVSVDSCGPPTEHLGSDAPPVKEEGEDDSDERIRRFQEQYEAEEEIVPYPPTQESLRQGNCDNEADRATTVLDYGETEYRPSKRVKSEH